MLSRTPRRSIHYTDLLGGSDHDFVVSMYLGVLRRWPDPDGYTHFMQRGVSTIEDRKKALMEIASSPEAQKVGSLIQFSETTSSKENADISTNVMTLVIAEVLTEQISNLQNALNVFLGFTTDDTYSPLSKLLDGDGPVPDFSSDLAELRLRVAATENSLADQRNVAAGIASEITTAVSRLIRHEVNKENKSSPSSPSEASC